MSIKCQALFIQEVAYGHGIAYPQVADGGGDLQILWVMENILNQ
jgi:hypothetical protein